MQAIWSFTFRDQIFFQLAKLKVPKLRAKQKRYAVAPANPPPLGVVPGPDEVVLEVTAEVTLDPDLDPNTDFTTLAEIADLDTPLGFKGNYLIFPLRRSNPLTDFMMVPYIDTALGLHDPDDLGSWTPEDFAAHARALVERRKSELSPRELQVLKDQLREQYQRIVTNPRPEQDEIVVPTSSLFIEALPGTHPLLEDFKLAHRILDVKKVQAETRQLELENLRRAARILANEYDDPDVDKRVIIEGRTDGTVVPADA